MDAVVTYRDEWLKVRFLLADDHNLPHQDIKAVSISQNKQKTREVLHKRGLQCLRFEVGRLKDLERICGDIGFPVFIKPKIGIRSEWGRRIDSMSDLKKYVTDVKTYSCISKGQFIVEEFLDGHEVDCDIVLWNGELLYAKTSDNFPVNRPFGLWCYSR